MDVLRVAVATPTPEPAPQTGRPVVLQPQSLDRASYLEFQAALHAALHRAPAVIVDFIWLEAIDAAGVDLLKNALHLAHRLGKALDFQSVDQTLWMALEQERDRLRDRNLGDWQQQCQADFNLFLQNRSLWDSETATVPDGEIVFPNFTLSSPKTA